MLIAIETSTRAGAVGVLEGEAVRELQVSESKEELAEALKALVAGRWDEVAGYAISIGPGSFTGLRLGLSLLKGVAFVHPRPVAAVPTLEAWAASLMGRVKAPAGRWFVPVVEARRGHVYVASFRARAEGGLEAGPMEAQVLSDCEWSDRLPEGGGVLGGTGLDALHQIPTGWERVDVRRPDIHVVARMGRQRLLEGLGARASDLEPAYALRSAAEENLAARSGSSAD